MPLELTVLPVGPLQANCYVLHDEAGLAVIVDPGGEPERIIARCRDLQPRMALLTHGHVDHVAAARAMQRDLGIPVLAHAEDWHFVAKPHPYFVQMVGGMEPCTPDEALQDGQEIRVGEITLQVRHTPGHSAGGVCLLWEGGVFTGDTLFAGSVGRTDLPGGDWATLKESLRGLIDRKSVV
jgi:hydroxyacylglutathione hydrolase